ncbi:sensor histidine kinase N-terminal domain-containing protein [Ancylobacter dichloromethanicus]|uniref:histidine kinase n=1 Tax=Ancylobacter dichloromethanicus TaxID=518825 RepID=A0A9W6N200_9HYPH|nr:ATP-binding protein [Ancylobacter dichloromethanicus]MBS7552956.1 sensor histidine kinase N-terminal domain-containing protein [Ancylobacter dichloromethanicus]GLK74562.1 two-component sensor histidine kinase [Ancylobacter dichloromethanicus]
MRRPRSLQGRLLLSLGTVLLVIWVGAAWTTAVLLRHEIGEVFDSSLQETAQRLLPLAVMDIVGREEGDAASQRLGAIHGHDELFTYVVRDDKGKVLLQSHAADLSVFPPYSGSGFGRTATHRLYSEEALQGTVRITVAEPLAHEAGVAREVQIGLGLPILLVIPAAFVAVMLAVRRSTRPLRAFRERLETRSEKDLGHVASDDLPSEVAPLAVTLNALLERLRAAFEAERSLAANTAHELRNPLAGAIAQAQRLQKETADPHAAQRGADIEATLKRLTARAERLMQLARAEGGQLRLDRMSDLRAALRVVIDDMHRGMTRDRVSLRVPETPVMSDIDPDVIGIICRNLVENALSYGGAPSSVEVTLAPDGLLTVSNEGPVVPPEMLAKLAGRFERAGTSARGSGIGLSIVSTIAERIGSPLTLRSPRPGMPSGFEAGIRFSIGRDIDTPESS